MSGIGDQGMMPDKVRPQRADDDTMDERVATPPDVEDLDAEEDPDAETDGVGDPEASDPEGDQSTP